MRDCMLFVDYAICVLGGSGDEVINESYKCLHLIPVDGFLVVFFSSESCSLFRPLTSVF